MPVRARSFPNPDYEGLPGGLPPVVVVRALIRKVPLGGGCRVGCHCCRSDISLGSYVEDPPRAASFPRRRPDCHRQLQLRLCLRDPAGHGMVPTPCRNDPGSGYG